MKRLLTIGILGFMLLLGPAPTVLSDERPSAELTPRSTAAQPEEPVPYDLPAMLAALAELTGWPVFDWPLPEILQLSPQAFERLTQLSRRNVFGLYVAETNRVFLNLRCRSIWVDRPEAFCGGTLFHELVHWGQHHSGMDEVMSGTEQERHALDHEIRYVETKLGLLDMYPPEPPSPDTLPPLSMPIRLSQGPLRVAIQDAAGQRHWVWVVTGIWLEAHAMKRYQGQLMYDRAHWVGVQVFELGPWTERELVEAWWDAGYLPETGVSPESAFPVNPIYQGYWIRTR